jgi:DMSO/TMAO reductase YedYZ molybdopterin-dependent catalytic subunit
MTMQKFRINRRSFLTSAALGGSALALGGCDAFDSLSNPDNRVRNFLEGANDLTYRVQRLLGGGYTMAQEFSEADIRQPQRPNGVTAPDDPFYKNLQSRDFADWRLEVSGLVEKPLSLTRDQLIAMPSRTQITRHDCVEGWSAIGKWKGVPLSEVLALVRPNPAARYVVFHCADPMDAAGTRYYESIDMEDAYHPQTILAYELNDGVLPIANGAPLRVRIERQLGYKMAKYIMRIEVVESFEHIGGGQGGYWEDEGYEWYAGI